MSIFLKKRLVFVLNIFLFVCSLTLHTPTLSGLLLETFEQIQTTSTLNEQEKMVCLVKKASELEIPFERVPTHGSPLLQYYFQNTWNLLDPNLHAFYLQLDNQRLASFDEIADDPFLILRTKVGGVKAFYSFAAAQRNLANYKIVELDHWPLLSNEDLPPLFEEPASQVTKDLKESTVKILEVLSDYVTILSLSETDKGWIWWQIASDKNFEKVVPNFNQIQMATNQIEIDSISETFLNPDQEYYVRVKSLEEEEWSAWSTPLSFTIQKPTQVSEVEFSKISAGQYRISWAEQDPDTTYRIYGSNALDFVPPIYQVVSDYDSPTYIELITKQNQIDIDGKYAYYRIIPEKKGRFGVPSDLVRVFDDGMFHERTLLQSDGETIIREAFPPLLEAPTEEEKQPKGFQKPEHVDADIWAAVSPHLLPDNHPARSVLDRIFSKRRVLENQASLRRAGFKWTKEGSHSPIFPTRHKKVKGYYIKLYLDSQKKVDWRNWVMRCQGAVAIQATIDKHQELHKHFKVPKKYIYPLPEKPSPKNKNMYRKNFVLLSEDMQLVKREINKALFKTRITPTYLNGIYKIVTEVGLADSLYINNLPWAKDGRIAFVDTERHHSWPVTYQRLNKILSTQMRQHWNLLIKHNGPNF